MTLAIINCMKSKQSYACGPREMYWPSLLFRSQVQFIEKRYDNWILVSSHYGVVTQDQILEPYDAYIGSSGLIVKENTTRLSAAAKREWGHRVASELYRYQKDYDIIDAFLSYAYVVPLPDIAGVRFLKANSGGRGLFRAIQTWKRLAISDFSTDELIEQGELLPSSQKEIKVASEWEEEMRAKRWWYHPEFGSHYSDSVYEMTKYAKQFDPLIDGATLGMVIKGKCKQHKGWALHKQGSYQEEATKVVSWIHPEHGSFIGSARDIAKKYNKDESNLKNVAIGKTKSSYGWRLNDNCS